MNKSAVSVGKNVVLTDDTAALFERDASVIFRVVDSRGVGANPMWKIARELGRCVDASDVLEVFGSDLRVVGE